MKRISMLLLLTVSLAACSGDDSEEVTEERVTPVEIEKAVKDDFIIDREIVGRASTANSSPVTARTPGELVTLNVEKGDRVEEGETIGVVDPGNGENQVELQQLAVRQAEKQLENAQITKEQAALGVENAEKQVNLAKEAAKSEESQTSQAVEAAHEQYQQAQQLADQTKKLVDEGAIPEALYQQAQSRADQAKAQYQQLKGQQPQSTSAVAQAEAQLDQAQQQLEQAQVGVDQAELQVEQANVQLNQAKDQTANEAVTAPTSGEISTLNASEGDFVTNQQPFATVVGLNPMTVTASVTADQLSLFEKGEELEVAIDSINQTVPSTIQYVSSVPDDTGLYPVEAQVDNEDEKIKPGMMATILLPEIVVENTWIVPTDAVVEEGNETYIYHVVDEKAVRLDVEVVEAQTDRTAIEADLTGDAQVITTGQLTLSDGGKVTIMKEDA
ncbi:efflux RND transporter periplasmic adaptor subunit [Halobacillus mangrovi]|uniref:Efflux transporter periplasmic adaptor subunit n=1 Tax=Halobacillus mangrovi TaxID=402384 RepID=A0A1W5ZS35_9BACI|nr:efflux RND transporter periplasmic adaptor subunit [Halobacillus mangrovi]ARI76099.1 efflux transporter periplasmic adaptor subunit [Halobacillus mangrovi]